MMKKYVVRAGMGKYRDRDGNEKTRWATIGAVFFKDGNLSLKLDSVPLGWDGWAGLYPPKESENAAKGGAQPQQRGRRASQPMSQQYDDDIPF